MKSDASNHSKQGILCFENDMWGYIGQNPFVLEVKDRLTR